MKNLFNYIYKGANQEITQQEQSEKSASKIIIDYVSIRQLSQSLNKFDEEVLKSIIEKDSHLISTFQDLMGTLHGLLNVISMIKGEVEENWNKINEYDELKKKLYSHNSIIKNLQEEESIKLNEIYDEKRKMKELFQRNIDTLKQENLKLNQNISKLEGENDEIKQKNKILSEELIFSDERIEKLQKQNQNYRNQISQLLSVKSSASQQENFVDFHKLTLEKLCIYSKIRSKIYPYLELKDILSLSLTSKKFHYIIQHSFKKQVVPSLLIANKQKTQDTLKQVKQYEKIYDKFPSSNIKNNAIKYLFFKIKPGLYILPFLQEEPQEKIEKVQEKKSVWKSFFTKKDKQSKNLSINSLKNEEEFKEIQRKVELFFDRIFGISGAKDLQNFQQVMDRQLQQLKQQLKGNDKPYQLLCMSKFLFLQMCEMNNLLQVCFGELLTEHTQLYEIRQKNRDLEQNDNTFRNLVQNLANDKRQIEKRLWFLENESIKLRRENQKTQNTAKQILSKRTQLQKNIQLLEKQLQKVKHEYSREKKNREKLENQMENIIQILKEKQDKINAIPDKTEKSQQQISDM